MEVVRGLYYAVATFLLGIIAVSMIELVQGFKGAYLDTFQDIAMVLAIVGPVVFVVGGFAGQARRSRQRGAENGRFGLPPTPAVTVQSSTRTCVNCGKVVDDSAVDLCNHCGKPFAYPTSA